MQPSLSPSRAAPGAPPTVIAILAAYNEEDIIGQVIAHLVEQGVQVYYIDDGSTDRTLALVEEWCGRGVVGIERWERRAVSSWAKLLRRKGELAAELDADWFIHHDADEIRESPWEGLNLAEALHRVDRLSYNAVDFHTLDFQPTDDRWRAGDDPRQAFPYWAPCHPNDKLRINAWKKTATPVDLVSSGGHEARFAGRRVFPLRFLLRHYPIRSQAHGERKVFGDRLPRWGEEARERGWNVHYFWPQEGESFLRDPATLTAYDAEAIRAELVLRHRDVETLESALAAAHGGQSIPAAEVGELTSLLAAERERAEETSRALDRRNREWEAASRELDDRNREAERLGHELDDRNRDCDRLGHELDERNREAAALGAELESLRRELAAGEARLQALLASKSWRWTAPLRALLRATGRR